MKKLLAISIALGLVACGKPDLPDPTIEYPKPPEELMKKPEKLKTIKESDDGR